MTRMPTLAKKRSEARGAVGGGKNALCLAIMSRFSGFSIWDDAPKTDRLLDRADSFGFTMHRRSPEVIKGLTCILVWDLFLSSTAIQDDCCTVRQWVCEDKINEHNSGHRIT
jgi:hypothetical protein